MEKEVQYFTRNYMQRIKDYYYELLDNISKNAWVIHKEINFREIDEKRAI